MKVKGLVDNQGCSVNDGGRLSGGGHWPGDLRASYLLAVDHEIGEEAVVGGAHEISKEAGVGDSGQQF